MRLEQWSPHVLERHSAESSRTSASLSAKPARYHSPIPLLMLLSAGSVQCSFPTLNGHCEKCVELTNRAARSRLWFGARVNQIHFRLESAMLLPGLCRLSLLLRVRTTRFALPNGES